MLAGHGFYRRWGSCDALRRLADAKPAGYISLFSQFNSNERHTLALTAVGHFGAHFAMLLFPTLAVILAREEGLELQQVLSWSLAGYLIFGLGALPAGFLTDHLNARWVVRAGVLGLGLATMSVSAVEPGPAVAWCLALVGVFASFYHPAGLGLISRTVRARGAGLGLNGACGVLGIASAPLAAQVAAGWLGWRGAYLFLGMLLCLLGLAVSSLRIDEAVPGPPDGESRHESRERRILFLILLLAMVFGGLSYRAATVALPAYFAERVPGWGHGTATSLVYLCGMAGQFAGGYLADRRDLRILYLAFHALSLPFVLLMAAASGLPLLLVSGVFVFFNLGMQPIENSLVARFTPDRWRSTGFGLKFAATFGIGGLAVYGIRESLLYYSFAYVFVGIGVLVGLLCCIAGYLAWRTRAAPLLNRAA